MGVRWPGLPLSPLLDKTNSSSRSLALPHGVLLASRTDSVLSDQNLAMAASPPPCPRLRPLPPLHPFPSPLALPPARIHLPSPSKTHRSHVTPQAVLSAKPVNQSDSVSCFYEKEDVAPCRMKRPPKLQIPLQTSTLGVKELEDRKRICQDIHMDGGFHGMACRKGRRVILEDTYCAFPELNGDPAHAFFGVFDGHGGRNAAEFAAKHLSRNILEAAEKQSEKKRCIESAVRSGYLTTDACFLETHASGGASCVTALVKDGVMVVANAGDCRAVVSKAGTAVSLTSDHRVCRQDERQRIESLGGYVDCFSGVWRVQGCLAISRGIGDRQFKKWISAEPEIKTLNITPECEFLLLASDGLWDVVSNQEAVDCVRKILVVPNAVEQGLGSSKPQKSNVTPKSDKVSTPLLACRQLVNLATGRGCLDDVSVMAVNLQHFFQDGSSL